MNVPFVTRNRASARSLEWTGVIDVPADPELLTPWFAPLPGRARDPRKDGLRLTAFVAASQYLEGRVGDLGELLQDDASVVFPPKPGSWERRSSAGGPIPLRRATAPHFAQRVSAQYSPRWCKHWGRPRLTGMNCGF